MLSGKPGLCESDWAQLQVDTTAGPLRERAHVGVLGNPQQEPAGATER